MRQAEARSPYCSSWATSKEDLVAKTNKMVHLVPPRSTSEEMTLCHISQIFDTLVSMMRAEIVLSWPNRNTRKTMIVKLE